MQAYDPYKRHMTSLENTMEPLAALIIWALSLVILIFVIGAGVRVGMRWSRIDERKEQEARNQPAYRNGQSVFNYKPSKKFK